LKPKALALRDTADPIRPEKEKNTVQYRVHLRFLCGEKSSFNGLRVVTLKSRLRYRYRTDQDQICKKLHRKNLACTDDVKNIPNFVYC